MHTRAMSRRNLQKKCGAPRTPRHPFCASPRNRNPHGHVTSAIFGEICRKDAAPETLGARSVQACAIEKRMVYSRGKRSAPDVRRTFCASLHNWNALGRDKTEGPFYARIYRENAAPQTEAKLARQTLCEPAQSKHTWTCDQSHFMQKFTRKMPRPSVSTSIKHRSLPLPWEPLSVDTLFGEKRLDLLICLAEILAPMHLLK